MSYTILYQVTALVCFLCRTLCYMITTVQQDRMSLLHPSLRAHWFQTLKQSSSSTQNSTTSNTSLTRYPLCWHCPSGDPFAEFLAVSTQKKLDCSSSSSLDDHHDKRTHVSSQEVEAMSEHSSAQDNEDMPKLVLGTGISFKQNNSRTLPAPLPVQPGPLLMLMMVLWQEVQGVPVNSPHLTQTHQGRMWSTMI